MPREHRKMRKTYSRKEVAEITGIPERRVLFYTEQPLLLPSVKTDVGRGIAREYDAEAVFFLLLVNELAGLGFSLSRIRLLLTYLRLSVLKGKKLFVEGTFTKEPLVLSVSLSPNHALAEGSHGYEDELDVSWVESSVAGITVNSNKLSQVVINLNEIFRRGRW